MLIYSCFNLQIVNIVVFLVTAISKRLYMCTM